MLTPTPPSLVTLEGLRVAYTFKGNLYVQDSGGQPIQLTDSGIDSLPKLSDDGQKIIFNRGERDKDQTTYTINVDGGDEQEFVSSSTLAALGLGYDRTTQPTKLAFVPGTHQVLFQTYHTDPSFTPGSLVRPQQFPHEDILLLNLDNAKIRQILAPGKASHFGLSPDGKLVWVLSQGHLNVIGLDSKIVRSLRDLPTAILPDSFFGQPTIYWTSDSRKLNLMLPTIESVNPVPEAQTIWQYSLGSENPTEIKLSLPPLIPDFKLSPDGNWAVYNTPDPAGMHVENLHTSAVTLVSTDPFDAPGDWSPDNIHFIINNAFDGTYLGGIDGNVTGLKMGRFIGWLDNNRYINGGGLMGEIGKEAIVRVIDLPAGASFSGRDTFTFVFNPK
jgi:Tol biopolymer transport system component